ncbi:MAG: glycosyltransferase, partial [Candidatus Limosilactobacillus intestinavium]
MEKVIAISTDQNYLVPVETLIKSIAYNNRDIKIYVINEDISQEWFINLNRRLAPLGITVKDAKLDPAVIQDEQISVDYLSKMAYGRILIPEMIPEDR